MYVQKPRFALNRRVLKVDRSFSQYDFLTPRYDFKVLLLFVGKFQPFESKMYFGVFHASILSSPVFKVTTR